MSIERYLPQALQGRPLLQLVLTFAAGILACWRLHPVVNNALTVTLAIAGAALLLCILTRFTQWQPLLLCGLALGFFLCSLQYAALAAWPVEPGEYAQVSGVVKGVPVPVDEESYRLRLRVEQVEGESVRCADIYLYGEGAPPLSGSRITAEGRSRSLGYYANPGAFDYRQYLSQQGIAAAFYTSYKGWVRVDEMGPILSPASFCQWLRSGFDQALSVLDDQQQALVRGVFLGDDNGLDVGVRQALSLSGMAHVFAVSGLHVGYLVLLVRAVCGTHFRRRKLRFGVTLAVLLLYLGLTGWAASVLRAKDLIFAIDDYPKKR